MKLMLFIVLALLVSSQNSFANKVGPSFRYMIRQSTSLPKRCSATRIGRLKLASAGHCVYENVLGPSGSVEIVTELAGRWMKVSAEIHPDLVAYYPYHQLPSDVTVLTLQEKDEKFISGMEIYPPCETGPKHDEVLLGSSQWFRSLFEARLKPLAPENYISYFSVGTVRNKTYLGVIEEESGGGLFRRQSDDTLCWLAALSSRDPGTDFTLGATYSGTNALEWVKKLDQKKPVTATNTAR